jgi:hypothetical protein
MKYDLLRTFLLKATQKKPALFHLIKHISHYRNIHAKLLPHTAEIHSVYLEKEAEPVRSTESLLNEAHSKYAEGKLAEAGRIACEIITTHPHDCTEEQYSQAFTLAGLKAKVFHAAEAERYFAEALKHNPKNTIAAKQLSYLRISRGAGGVEILDPDSTPPLR